MWSLKKNVFKDRFWLGGTRLAKKHTFTFFGNLNLTHRNIQSGSASQRLPGIKIKMESTQTSAGSFPLGRAPGGVEPLWKSSWNPTWYNFCQSHGDDDDEDQEAGLRQNIKVPPRQFPLELATLLPLYDDDDANYDDDGKNDAHYDDDGDVNYDDDDDDDFTYNLSRFCHKNTSMSRCWSVGRWKHFWHLNIFLDHNYSKVI